MREPRTVVSFDAPAMYALVAYLLAIGRHLAARSMRVRRAGVTDRLAAFLAEPHLRRALRHRPAWSRWGLTFAAVRPRNDPLPAKARYNPGADEHLLAANPLDFDGTLWFHWADLAAAVVATGRVPELVDAITFVPVGTQDGLRPIRIRSGRRIDLAQGDDLFVTLVAERDRAKRAAGRGSREQSRVAEVLKLVIEAVAFGQLARFDPPTSPTGGTVCGPWGPLRTRTPLERAGPWCWPPAAAGVCAGARLLLALARTEVEDCGATPVGFDTDAVAVAINGDES